MRVRLDFDARRHPGDAARKQPDQSLRLARISRCAV